MKLFLTSFLALTLAAGCVGLPTKSGKPETMFRATRAEVKSALTGRLINDGYMLTDDSDYLSVFERDAESAFARILLGSGWDGTPNERVRLNYVKVGSMIRVIAHQEFVTNPGTGFERITTRDSTRVGEEFMALLQEVRSEVES